MSILPPSPDDLVKAATAPSNGAEEPHEQHEQHDHDHDHDHQHQHPPMWVEWRQKLQALMNDAAFHERRTEPKNVKLDATLELKDNVFPMLATVSTVLGHKLIEVLENVVVPGIIQALVPQLMHALLPDMLRQMVPEILDEIAPRDQVTPEMAELLTNAIHDLVEALGGEELLSAGLRHNTDKALTAIHEMTMQDLDDEGGEEGDGGEQPDAPEQLPQAGEA